MKIGVEAKRMAENFQRMAKLCEEAVALIEAKEVESKRKPT